MAAAETALPSISTLTALGPFSDTQEDILKVGSGGGLDGPAGVLGPGHRIGGWGLHLALEFTSCPAKDRESSVQARGLNLV